MTPPEGSAPLRVGYVVKRFPRVSETFIAQEILELERRGVEVRVFTLDENDQPAPHGWLDRLRAEVVPVPPDTLRDTWEALRERAAAVGGARRTGTHRALVWAFEAEKGRRDLSQALALATEAERRGVDRLHAHFANRPAFVALLAHSLSGIPFSVTAHAKDIYAKPPTPAVWRRLARHADFIATVSDANLAFIRERISARQARKLHRLYNGVDLDAIRPADRAPGPERAANTLALVCVARLVPKKGVDDLVAALAALRRDGVSLRCDVVGDGPERESLARQIESNGLADAVTLAGTLPHEEVIARVARADAVVLPCRVVGDGDRDVLPTVLLEAMAAGVACVSTPVGGVPEIVADGETGLLVPERDPAALADALRALAGDPARLVRMGAAARRRAEERFDRRRTVERLHHCFETAGRRERRIESVDAPAAKLAEVG